MHCVKKDQNGILKCWGDVCTCIPLHSKSANMAEILPINSDTVAENSSLDKKEGEVTPEEVIEVS